MTLFTDPTSLNNDDLVDSIITWSGRIAAGEAQLLRLIAEFDQREAWGGAGLLSCAHWLVWKTGLSPGAAREKVRVARALTELPNVEQALGTGQMSFSQARAVTRVATADDQTRWIELARHTTAAQLEKLVRGVHLVRRHEEDLADPELAAWRMRARSSYDDDGNRRIVILVPAQDAPVFDAALAQLQAELDHRRVEQVGVVAETPARATLGEALLEMARRTVDAAAPDRARRSRATLTAQVDPVSGWARLQDGELLPPTSLTKVSSLRQVLRGLPGRGPEPQLRPITAADLRRLDLGRSARLPSLALRELLGSVDGERCRFPGCSRHRRLHAHHVVRWSDGGATDLNNLVLVCGRHHTLIHQHGFQLRLADDRCLHVRTAAGAPVLHLPDLPWADPGELDPDRGVGPQTLPPDSVDRMDLGYCVMVLMQQAA